MPSFGYISKPKPVPQQQEPSLPVRLEDPHPGDILTWDQSKAAWTNSAPASSSNLKKLTVKGDAELQSKLVVKEKATFQTNVEVANDIKAADVAVSRTVSFFGSKPTGKQTNKVKAANFDAKSSGIQDDSATYGGYTMGQVVAALKNLGLLA